jgi:hypothetical protein
LLLAVPDGRCGGLWRFGRPFVLGLDAVLDKRDEMIEAL